MNNNDIAPYNWGVVKITYQESPVKTLVSVVGLFLFLGSAFAEKSESVTQQTTSVQKGVASYYGEKTKYKHVANWPERFDPKSMTAAHKTLPFGTRVKVTNLKNGKSVTVRINNRGPFIKGRIIDLTPAAFVKIAPKKQGLARVKVEVL